MLDLTDLELFARVVETRSLTVAGRELGLSAAVISKRLQRLERQLGVRLLHRTTRFVGPTAAGQRFFNRIGPANAAIREAELEAVRDVKALSGTLRISAPTSFARLHVAPHLPAFLAAYPQLLLDIDLSDDFVDMLAGSYDVAIRIGTLEDSVLVARRLAPVRRVLCAAPAYLARHGRPASLAELAQHARIAARHQSPWRLKGPEGDVAVPAASALSTNSSEVIREAVIAGLGIALRSTWDVGEELADGRLEQVLPAYGTGSDVAVHAVTPSAAFTPEKVRAFVAFLADLYRPVPYWDRSIAAG